VECPHVRCWCPDRRTAVEVGIDKDALEQVNSCRFSGKGVGNRPLFVSYKYKTMAKNYHDFLKDMMEWSAPTAHTAHTTIRMSVKTGKAAAKAKRPSVKQLEKLPYTQSEKEKKGIHFFQLGEK
jgi:hypothetical protein